MQARKLAVNIVWAISLIFIKQFIFFKHLINSFCYTLLGFIKGLAAQSFVQADISILSSITHF